MALVKKPNKNGENKATSIRIDRGHKKEIQEIIRKTGRTRTDVVNHLLGYALENNGAADLIELETKYKK